MLQTRVTDLRTLYLKTFQIAQRLQMLQAGVGDRGTIEIQVAKASQVFQSLQAGIGDFCTHEAHTLKPAESFDAREIDTYYRLARLSLVNSDAHPQVPKGSQCLSLGLHVVLFRFSTFWLWRGLLSRLVVLGCYDFSRQPFAHAPLIWRNELS